MSDGGTTCSDEDRIKGIMYSKASKIRSAAKPLSPRSMEKYYYQSPGRKREGWGEKGRAVQRKWKRLILWIGA